MVAVVFLFLTVGIVSALAGNHSLFFIYTLFSKHLDQPGIHHFTALSVLDGEVLKNMNVPKNLEKVLDKEQNLRDIMTDCMGTNNSEELHVLQWRRGCVIEDNDGEIKVVEGFDEYGCDGTDFLSFSEANSSWFASVQAAEKTKIILDEHVGETKSFLTGDCLEMFKEFTKSTKTAQNSPPEVFLFTRRLVNDTSNLTLTCLATGFYPKGVQIQVRKSKTSLPQGLLTSSGTRPNDNYTYQLRMSVNIVEAEKELYECYVTHITLGEPAVVEAPLILPNKNRSSILSNVSIGMIGMAVGILFMLIVTAGVCIFFTDRGYVAWQPIRGSLTKRLLEVMCPKGSGNTQAPVTMPAQGENQENIPMLEKED